MNDTFIILSVAVLTAVTCSLNGALLVLRKQAMTGDAISHAILPGIAIAFLWSGSRSTFWMLLGASILGVFTVLLTDLIRRRGRIRGDAALGIVFTTLFAIGVVLISKYSANIDLDQECVLYGEIAYTPWDRLQLAGIDLGVRALWMQAMVLVPTLLFLKFAYARIVVYTFDEAYGSSTGLRMKGIHYTATFLTAMTTVASFESVGAILVVALLIIPSATALLFAESVPKVLVFSAVAGILASVSGMGLASISNTSIAASIAVAALTFFLLGMVVKRIQLRKLKTPSALNIPEIVEKTAG